MELHENYMKKMKYEESISFIKEVKCVIGENGNFISVIYNDYSIKHYVYKHDSYFDSAKESFKDTIKAIKECEEKLK